MASIPPWDLERREVGAAHDGTVGAALQAAGDLVGFDRDLAAGADEAPPDRVGSCDAFVAGEAVAEVVGGGGSPDGEGGLEVDVQRDGG